MGPGEDLEGVEQEQDTYENDPYGPSKGAKQAVLVGWGAIVRDSIACTSHLVDEEPNAKSDEEEGDNSVDGKVMEEASISDQEDATQADEPESARGKAITWEIHIGIDRVGSCAVRRDRSDGWCGVALPRRSPGS
jgi:hypothetical protein